MFHAVYRVMYLTWRNVARYAFLIIIPDETNIAKRWILKNI